MRFAGEMIAETSSNYSIWCYAHPPHPVFISLGEKCCILEADPHFLLTIKEKTTAGGLRREDHCLYLAKAPGHVYNPRRAG